MTISLRWPTAIWGGPKWLTLAASATLGLDSKLPTQSQMVNGNLKVCVQNAKFIVYHMNFGKFANFRTSQKNLNFGKFLKKIFLNSFFKELLKIQKCTNFIAFITITHHYRFE